MSTQLTTLNADQMRAWLHQNVPVSDFRDKRVLLIVPDNTRTAPLPVLFPALRSMLRPVTKSLDVLVALGTHPPMPQQKIRSMLGIADGDPCDDVGLFNHAWDNPAELATIGVLTEAETREISDGVLSMEVPVQINRRILDYDIALIVGPVFPHEVVGFSGGNKYFFPGISGPELLNFFHWLGALITNVGIIGVQDTPVRRVVDRAAKLIKAERRCLAFVVSTDATPYGMFYGTPEEAWRGASNLSGTGPYQTTYETVSSGAVLCTGDVRRTVGRREVHVQAGAGRCGWRRVDHLRSAHERDLDHSRSQYRTHWLPCSRLLHEAVGQIPRPCHYPRNSSPAAGLPGSSEVLKLAVKQLKIRSHAGSSGMSQSFSLAFRLDKRAGDGHIEAICLISKRIHLHDKRAGVSMSWVMTRAKRFAKMNTT
jgi:hypothetical protein